MGPRTIDRERGTTTAKFSHPPARRDVYAGGPIYESAGTEADAAYGRRGRDRLRDAWHRTKPINPSRM